MNQKTLLTIGALLLGSIFSTYSQDGYGNESANLDYYDDTESKDVKYNAYKTTWMKNRFKDNWFITFGAGAQFIMGEDDHKVDDFKNRLTVAPTLSIGKYFSPIWGLKLTFTGGSLHGFNDGRAGTYTYWSKEEYKGIGMATVDPRWIHEGWVTYDPVAKEITRDKSIIGQDGENGEYFWIPGDKGELYMQHVHYLGGHVDFFFDLITLFGNYNPKRIFEITPSAGVGVYHRFANLGDISNTFIGANAGLMFKFRLSERINFNIEGNATYLPSSFDGHEGNERGADGIVQATAGFSVKLGKTRWDVSEPMNYETIKDLNDEISRLRAIAENIKECEDCPECPPVQIQAPEPAPIKFLPDPVRFRLDKSIIDNGEWSKIEKAVDYLNKYPNTNIIITGYADKQTGTPGYNMRLSERRAKAVSQALIERYGINPLRLSINWEGDKIQPFEVNEWNRVVVFVIEE